jgi:acyl carrier protein
MNEFYEGLADILEVPVGEINPELELSSSGNWDSLAVVSTIALIDEVFDEAVNADALADCKSVSDIEQLVQKKQAV